MPIAEDSATGPLGPRIEPGTCLANFVYFVGGLEYIGHSFAYVAHFVFLELSGMRIRTQRDAVASRRITILATNLPNLATHGRWLDLLCGSIFNEQ
jgi:hypothetical protein